MIAEDFRESKVCPICEGNTFKIIYNWENDFYPHRIYETNSWDGRQSIPLSIVECSGCQLIQTRPSFKEEHLDKVYSEDIVPETIDYSAVLRQKKWFEIIRAVKKYLPNKSIVCDIGTRYGGLVHKLSSDHDAFGIELNSRSVELARRNDVKNIYQGDISNLLEICKEINLVRVNGFIMDDVLEHLVNPSTDLAILNSLQREGDMLFMRQMNWNSFGHKLYGKKWYYLQPAAHMYYFNVDTVIKLLSSCGYRVVHVEFDSLLKNFKKLLVNIKWELFGRQKKWMVNDKIMYLNDRRGLADMFLVVAEKEEDL